MFHEKNYFQLLSCLYLYNSGIPVPVCIRKQSRSTDFWRLALIYRAVGLPTSGAGVDIPSRRSTDFWRRREVCAKSVDRLLASKVLKSSIRNSENSFLQCFSSYARTGSRQDCFPGTLAIRRVTSSTTTLSDKDSK